MPENINPTGISVGMGGWDLFPFNGLFYPREQGKGFRKLRFYSHFFDLVEINATFYNSTFSPGQINRWLQDVAENDQFLFTVKLYRGFTHTFSATKAEATLFSRMLEMLEGAGRLGGLLMQFPSLFEYSLEHRLYLGRLLRGFRGWRVYVEVRHRSWNTPAAIDFLQQEPAQIVNVDLPPLPGHIPFASRSGEMGAYFRMMGRNRANWLQPWRLERDGKHMVSDRYQYCYAESELVELATRVNSVRGQSPVFVVFHNDPQGNSLYNGFRLRTLLRPEIRPEIPRRLLAAFPALAPPELAR